MAFFVFTLALVLTVVFGFFGYQRVIAKSASPVEETIISETKPEIIPVVQSEPIKPTEILKPLFNTQLLTADIDWTEVTVCLKSEKGSVLVMELLPNV